MQDPRIRLISIISLSFASLLSLPCALFTLLWWVIFGRVKTSVRSFKSLVILLLLPLIMGFAAWFTGHDGVSYFIRMTAVLIIASWMYAERYQGEFLDLGVWFFGDRIGFDLGLIGELSISTLEGLVYEIERINIALSQKGEKLNPMIIPAVFSSLLMRQFVLSHDRACLLATRGYMGGGTHYPVFHTSVSEWIAGIFAIFILVVSFFSRDLFIIFCQTYNV